jgi:Fe-S-cluster containining protein
MCGECCRGRGGVYLDREGAAAAARHLGLDLPGMEAVFLEREPSGLYSVLNAPGPEGHCLLFRGGQCLIHPVKPLVCRAWPRLWALVTDPRAFLEAAEACPGLSRLGFEALSAEYRSGGKPLPPRSYKAVLLARSGMRRQGGHGFPPA